MFAKVCTLFLLCKVLSTLNYTKNVYAMSDVLVTSICIVFFLFKSMRFFIALYLTRATLKGLFLKHIQEAGITLLVPCRSELNSTKTALSVL